MTTISFMETIPTATTVATFSRQQVETEPLVRLTDHDEVNGLDLFCYTKCDDHESDFIKQCRGLVYHGDKLVMKAFPYTSEYPSTDTEFVTNVLTPLSEWRFFEAYEGALLRMFYFNDRWYLSTHRKLDAFRSKWSSRESFGTQFVKALLHHKETDKAFADVLNKQLVTFSEDVLVQFQAVLNKNHQYMFLVCNTKENRIVCKAPTNPTAYHVGTFIDGTFDVTDCIGIPKPIQHNFQTATELLQFVTNSVDASSYQGLVAFGPENKQLKIITPTYQELFRVRGNEPSVKFRYLQVRLNKKMVKQLMELYPEHKDTFEEYEHILYNVSVMIYNAYVQRFIKKRYVTVPQEEFQVIRDCHSWHLCSRDTNRINLEQIIRVLNLQTPVNLNHMIRHYKAEQLKKDEHPTRPRSMENSPVVLPLSSSIPVTVTL